tara:strand:+ start:2611 stop:2841 length:231 start_codon:yes stop_codon:yes gene_type:complete
MRSAACRQSAHRTYARYHEKTDATNIVGAQQAANRRGAGRGAGERGQRERERERRTRNHECAACAQSAMNGKSARV